MWTPLVTKASVCPFVVTSVIIIEAERGEDCVNGNIAIECAFRDRVDEVVFPSHSRIWKEADRRER